LRCAGTNCYASPQEAEERNRMNQFSKLVALALVSAGLSFAQDAKADIAAAQARLSDEKSKLAVDKLQYDKLKSQLDELKKKIKLQEDNVKLLEKRIKNNEKLKSIK
jgi:septal ring factor EnvC (AmiA/AmiB activator)